MTNRIDEIRGGTSYRAIAETINNSTGVETSASTISKLAKGDMQLTEKWLRMLADALGCTPGEILEPHQNLAMPTEHPSDVALCNLPENSPLAGLVVQSGRQLYKIKTTAMDELRLQPGDLILVDTAPSALANLRTGDVVVADWKQPGNTTQVLRQFIEPRLLTTNARSDNAAPINMADDSATVIALVLHYIRTPHKQPTA